MQEKKNIRHRIALFCKKAIAFLLNPRLLLCVGVAWMLTNGWCYLFLFFGLRFGITWMASVGGAYAAFLWFPFTPEKVATAAIALFLLRRWFPHDTATLKVLTDAFARAKKSLARRKKKKKD